MINLTGWRTVALLAVACGLFLAADAVPKPTTIPKPPAVRDSSAGMSKADVRVNVVVPLLRKLAKYNKAWNEFLLYGPVGEQGSTDRNFEHAGDIYDSAFLDSYVEHLMEDITEKRLEKMSNVVWSITPDQMEELVTEAVSKLPVGSGSRKAMHVASLDTGFTNGTDRTVAPRNGDGSQRQLIYPPIPWWWFDVLEDLIEEVEEFWPTPYPVPWMTPHPLPWMTPHPLPWTPLPHPTDPDLYDDYYYDDHYYGGGGGGAGGWGDPHLTGFDNRKFLLTGDATHEYNLFSADSVALNTRMYVDNDKTFFKQFNLVASGDSLRIDMDPANKTVAVTVNGVLLDRQDIVDTGNMSVTTQAVGKTNLKVSVSTKSAAFTFDTRLYKRPHLDFSLELTRDLRKDEAGGILGHTFHRGADVPHPADMADDEVVARYASRPVTARVAGSSSNLASRAV